MTMRLGLEALVLRETPLFRLARPFLTSIILDGERALAALRIAHPTPELEVPAVRLLDKRSCTDIVFCLQCCSVLSIVC